MHLLYVYTPPRLDRADCKIVPSRSLLAWPLTKQTSRCWKDIGCMTGTGMAEGKHPLSVEVNYSEAPLNRLLPPHKQLSTQMRTEHSASLNLVQDQYR